MRPLLRQLLDRYIRVLKNIMRYSNLKAPVHFSEIPCIYILHLDFFLYLDNLRGLECWVCRCAAVRGFDRQLSRLKSLHWVSWFIQGLRWWEVHRDSSDNSCRSGTDVCKVPGVLWVKKVKNMLATVKIVMNAAIWLLINFDIITFFSLKVLNLNPAQNQL